MSLALEYRGPDFEDFFVKQDNDQNIGLAHRRLSIIDISKLGNQPMYFENLVMVFNGEVYNYVEIREKLLKKGYKFISNSDTEVVIKAFHCYGKEAVNQFIGMFAFAIYDQISQKLYLGRDRFGVKPLFIYRDNNTLCFASELKSLMSIEQLPLGINNKSVNAYLRFGYVPHNESIFKNVSKLKPGSIAELDINNGAITQVDYQYWSLDDAFSIPKRSISLEEAQEELRELLMSSFQYRMVADVNVGVFLSGGYDSSLVAGMLVKESGVSLNTFTIGFDDPRYNEAPAARKVAEYLGTNHEEVICTENDALGIVERLPFIYDEPFADSSAIPTILVSQMASERAKVVLSADGGDEMFGGYSKYEYVQRIFGYVNQIPGFLRSGVGAGLTQMSKSGILKANALSKANKMGDLLSEKDTSKHADILSRYLSDEDLRFLGITEGFYNNRLLDKILREDMSHLDGMRRIDFETYLPDDILCKVDRATMSVSIEGREPFLDHRILELANSFPEEFLINNGSKKFILKELAHQYIPKELLDRPKAGFAVPLDSWLRSPLRSILLDSLDKSFCHTFGFDHGKLQKLLSQFENNKGAYATANKLWSMLMLAMWQNQWQRK